MRSRFLYPSVRPDRRCTVLAIAVAALVAALLVIYAPRSPELNEGVISPDVSQPVTSATTRPTTGPDGDQLSESIRPPEPASLVDGAILLPDGFRPRDTAESDNGLMVVRAETTPQPSKSRVSPQIRGQHIRRSMIGVVTENGGRQVTVRS